MKARGFGADRSVFLNRFPQLAPLHGVVGIDRSGRIPGVIAGRTGNGMVAAGPWANGSMDPKSLDLLSPFSSRAAPFTISINVPENQKAACPRQSVSFLLLPGKRSLLKKATRRRPAVGKPGLALAGGTPASG